MAVRFWIRLNLEMLGFEEEGRPEKAEKILDPGSKDDNQQQTQPTYGVDSRNRTRASLVAVEYSPHCHITVALQKLINIQ